jgi:peptidoglycan/xylan/chitin deacetylase (PgdA/CDA1 family)
MNPIALATQGKGSLGMVRRAQTIGRRYGLTAAKMERTLAQFADILGRFQCGATFPITTAALARNPRVLERYQSQQIEFAVHGYYHIDHRRLSLDEQLAHFTRARHIFESHGVGCQGFRSPYLRWSAETIAAVGRAGFSYDSSQGLSWEVVADADTAAYQRVLGFYGARPADSYPSLPRITDGLVHIPYCLPDDEALVDRLQLTSDAPMARLWLAILGETHRLGELFTLGLHPERAALCGAALAETLRAARALEPAVWIARLDEIAGWWRARSAARVTIDAGRALALGEPPAREAHGDSILLHVDGPAGTTILARGVELPGDSRPWDGAYRRVEGDSVELRADRRPFIGVSHRTPPELSHFLRQQGLIVEQSDDPRTHTIYLDRPRFTDADERPLLDQIEGGDAPLVRLGRWPHGARSALCVTGDIDALTIWDYGLRFFGH